MTDTRLIHFFLVPAEFLSISMYDNTIKTDSNSTHFRLLQTSLSLYIRDNAGYNKQIEITTTASMLMQQWRPSCQ